MTSQKTLFPENPKNGTIFELRSGLYFQYDATLNSWIKIASNTIKLSLATSTSNGSMSAADLRKLNRLVLAPPFSSIIGNDCVSPFTGGNISLISGDKFVGVDGNATLRNIGSRGEVLSKSMPFKIHQHTYGFDFTIDLPNLVEELKRRGQFNVTGKQGNQGIDGDPGDPGPDSVLSGPPGDKGLDGSAPACALSVEPDTLQAEPHEGMTKALVAVRVVQDTIDSSKYKLVFDRQSIGPLNFAADKFNVRSDSSSWVLAIASGDNSTTVTATSGSIDQCNQQTGGGTPQQVYYVDIEPLIEVVHQEFLKEAATLKKGYEDIVGYWIQTMSDLFDEQKAALCCALQFCISATKSTDMRQHMENVAASAAGSANILLHGRTSKESVQLSSTRLLKEVGGPDLCRGGPPFPQPPKPVTATPPPPPTPAAKLSEVHADSEGAVDKAIVTVDPLVHSSAMTGVHIPLKAGDYTAIVDSTTAQIDNQHRANVKIQHIRQGIKKTVQFLDKGSFDSIKGSQQAYQGLSLSFRHDGGIASFWLPSNVPQMTSGAVTIVLQPSIDVPPQEVKKPVFEPDVKFSEPVVNKAVPDSCEMSISHLSWYERGWLAGNCCGAVVNIMGQDFIIVKRSIGNDMGCGGGESENTPCIAQFMNSRGHPAFAWPTLDGRKFAPLPKTENVTFHYDEKLNELVARKIADGDFLNGKGNPAGVRHLTYQFTTVLFPAG
jgi:hypothetical protein